MSMPGTTDTRMTDNRIAVESIACILRYLVDGGMITAEAARVTMVDSVPTLTDPAIRTLWEEATEVFAGA